MFADYYKNGKETKHNNAGTCLCSRSTGPDPVESAKLECFGPGHRSDQEWSFAFVVHFTLRDSPKHEITFLDLPLSELFIAPPSGLFLVSAKVDGCLDLDGFDGVNGWLYIFFGIPQILCPI